MRLEVVVLAAVLAASWMTGLSGARADVREVGPSDDIEDAMNALEPGDELVLRGGMYELPDERFGITLMGTETAPIVIRAKNGEQPHLHRPNASQNIVDVIRAEHAVIRGIEFSGGSAGIRVQAARFFTIEDCEVHGTDDVAVRFNSSGAEYEAIRILRNHIHDTDHTGEGMYIGCNSGGCRMFDSLIEGNYIHHTNKSTVIQGDGIEIKEGSHDNIIRNNVIHDTNYPCIITYGTIGRGGPNIIEGNLLWNCADNGIQSAADTVIRNNIILSAGGSGIAMQPHQTESPSDLVVVHNTVFRNDGTALAVRNATGDVTIANNALYAGSGQALLLRGGDTSGILVTGNVGVGSVEGTSSGVAMGDLVADFLDAHYNGHPPIDVFPAAGGALVAGGDSAHVVELDFNGTPRNGAADVGAYLFDAAGNPGWVLAPELKTETTMVPMPDGGTPMSDGGTEPPPADGGVVSSDSGSVMADAGTSGGDDAGASSPAGDAGRAGSDEEGTGDETDSGAAGAADDGGCSISGRSGSVSTALLLLIPLLRSRRRRNVRVRRARR